MFRGFKMTSNVDVNEDKYIVHFSLFLKTKPITLEEAITNSK